jgi:hypothetical protein
MTDRDVLQRVKDAFAGATRPEHYTKHTHCDECREIDQVLSAKKRDAWTGDDFRDINVLPLLTSEAFRYCFPSLVRLALADDRVLGWVMNILGMPIAKGEHVLAIPHIRYFNTAEIRATSAFVVHVCDSRRHLFEHPSGQQQTKRLLRHWQADVY